MAQVRKYSDVTRSLERVESIHADFVQHVEIAAKQLRPGCSDARITLQDNLFDGRPAEIVIGIRSELHRRIHRRDERSRPVEVTARFTDCHFKRFDQKARWVSEPYLQ